jgi:thiamine-phosphate pyrophosphorylase
MDLDILRPVGRLHVLTDATLQDRYTHEEITRLAIEGGAETIQFREKRGSTRALIATARALMDICRKAGVPLLVNDRIDVALAADASGVHLGTEDFPVSLAREILGPDRIIGASAGNLAEARRAMWAGADYVGVGPVFASGSKDDAGAALGAQGLREIVSEIEIPVIAIGGIDASRVAEIAAAGAYGIAVIQAVSLNPDPAGAAAALRGALRAALEKARGAAESGA